MTQRSILHLDLDAFFVSVEQIKNPALRGKPVIVGGGDRGVVAACSYEARRYGVHSAMPSVKARQLCPQAIFVKGSFEDYGRYSALVTDILNEHAPVLEKASIDEFYVDMTGMERFFGCMAWAQDIKRRIVRETGLSITFALASSKLISKMACQEYKPDGQVQIEHGQEMAFLAPLDVSRIPMVGEKTARLLKTMGIYTIGTLATTPVSLLERQLGRWGKDLWEKAHGRDDSPVVPHSARKSISTESTFHADTADTDFLRREIHRMANELGYELRQKENMTGCLAVKIRYNDFETHTHQISIPFTCADHLLVQNALAAFEHLYNRKRLVRLLGVRLSKLCKGGAQLNLFDDSARMAPLYSALDRIRDRYGTDAVRRAVTD